MKGLAFYETSAQIIPVLLLVVAIQMRSFDTSRPVSMWFRGRSEPVGIVLGSLDAFVLMALYVVIVAAEMVALVALYTGTDEPWEPFFVGYVVFELLTFIGFAATGLTARVFDNRS